MYALSVHKHVDYSSPIMFVPLGTTTQTTTVQRPTVQKKIVPNKAPQSKNSPAPPVSVKKSTTVAAPAQKKEEKKQATTLQPVQQEKKENKEVIENKPTQEIKKAIPAKIEPIKKEATKPVAQPIQEKSIKEISQSETAHNQVQEKINEKKVSSPLAMQVPENAHISHNHREVEALRRGAQLQKELVHKWQPPIGVASDCTCDVSFFVTKQGKIENLKMIKSSGVVIFDISARQALFSMKMPQWTYGKPLIISFKQ